LDNELDVVFVNDITAETGGETEKIYVDKATNKSYYWTGVEFVRIDDEKSVVFVNDITAETGGNTAFIYIDKATNKSYRWDNALGVFVRLDNESETLTTFDLTFDCSTFIATATYVDEAGTSNVKTIDLSCISAGYKIPVPNLKPIREYFTPCIVVLLDGTSINLLDPSNTYPLYFDETITTLPIGPGDRIYNADGTLNMEVAEIAQGPQWINPNVVPSVLQAENLILYPEQAYTRYVSYGVVGKLTGTGC
jgi:hypothetical protein